MGGLFGSGETDWQDILGRLFAGLQDAGAAYQGRSGGAVQGYFNNQKRLGDNKKYQDTLKAAFGSESPNTLMSTPLAPAAAAMMGQPNDIAGRQAAMQNDKQSMMFSGPTGQAMGYDMASAAYPMLQGMDAGPGQAALMNMTMQGLENSQRRNERAEDRGYDEQVRDLVYNRTRGDQLADNARRQLTPDELKQRNYRPGTVVFVDGLGRETTSQESDVMSPEAMRQRQQIAIMGRTPDKPPAPPSGYMTAPNGQGLTFIPGGPADPAVAGRGTGKPTEDQAKNAQLYTLSKQILPQVIGNFDSLASPVNNALSFGGAMTTSAAYQQAENGLNSLVANFLYSTSGATATPQEVQNRAATVRPRVGDSAETISLKKKALNDMVESIKLRASPQLLNQQPSSAAPPASGPPKISSGTDYDRLPSGALYIGPDGQQRRKR